MISFHKFLFAEARMLCAEDQCGGDPEPECDWSDDDDEDFTYHLRF